MEEARIPIPASPSLLNSAKEKNPDLENLNGITRICVGSPRTVTETSNSCPTVEVQPTIELSNPPLSSQQEMTSCEVPVETNQPKVSLVSNNTPVPSPSSPTKISDSVSDIDSLKRTIEMKSVEVQADTIKDYLYNDYGLTTPPFDVPADEQISRPVEPRLYTNIGQNLKDDLTLERDVCEKNAVVTRTVEVQVDPPPSRKECPYNDYGLTPPNEVQLDDHTSRSQETCLYTDIGQNHKDLSDNEKIVKETYISDSEQIDAHNSEVPQVDDVAQERTEIEIERPGDVIDNPEILPNAKKKFDYESCPVDGVNVTIEHDSEFEDFENQLDISEMTNIDTEYDTEEIDVESCPDPDKDSPLVPDEAGAEVQNHNDTHNFEIRVNPELQIPKDAFSTFKTSDQIDTGQKVILNTAPNIEAIASIDNCSETKDTVPETFNGNTVLKPLLSSNRTNGQAKDVGATPTKIMYTSSQKIKSTTLDDFSRFESAMHVQWNKMKENHDFEEILSGPVSKIMPTKHNNLLAPSDKLDIFNTISQEANTKAVTNTNSRSNSPTEMTSPAYEAIDDFRNYFSDSVNGRVPPTHDVRVPQSILKKNNSTRKKNYRIMFHESTCDNSEERRLRSDGVLVPKRVRRDRKLNMEPRVVVERLSFIENKMKKVLNNPPTLRVDYDKTTTHINEKDVVRCISPPRFSWIVNLSPSRHNPGNVKSSIDAYCKKVSLKCEQNKSSCCNQLAEQFNKLNCNVTEDKALNLSIPGGAVPVDPETEFSNSPTFLPDTDKLVQHCLEETSVETASDFIKQNSSLLCDNSNFYKSQTCLTSSDNVNENFSSLDNINPGKRDFVESSSNNKSNSEIELKEPVADSLIQLPTAVPETYDFEKNLKNEVFSKIDWQSLEDSDCETRLPLKKRKLSVANKNESVTEEQKKEEISYPATPMISIAEVEALHPRKLQANNARPFKTPAERKEMPPLPVFYNVESDPSPIITDQFNINNHTYNNPTINYHMNNVPVPFINIPCGSYYSLPPILVPFNNVSTFDQSKMNTQQQENYVKKESRKQGRQRRRH